MLAIIDTNNKDGQNKLKVDMKQIFFSLYIVISSPLFDFVQIQTDCGLSLFNNHICRLFIFYNGTIALSTQVFQYVHKK